jgi:hypothetical protein
MDRAGYPQNSKGNTYRSVMELHTFVRNNLNPPFTNNLQSRGLFWGHTRPLALWHLLVILRVGDWIEGGLYRRILCGR